MIQPFVQFEAAHLAQLVRLKRTWLVSQTYTRGINHLEEILKTDILLTDYEDNGLAKVHLNALKNDRYAAIIDLTKPAHYDKLGEMLAGDHYKLYWGVVKSKADLQKRLDAGYKEKVRRYIENRTNWRVPGGEAVKIKFEVIFGELFLNLKWRTQNPRINFKEIERL